MSSPVKPELEGASSPSKVAGVEDKHQSDVVHADTPMLGQDVSGVNVLSREGNAPDLIQSKQRMTGKHTVLIRHSMEKKNDTDKRRLHFRPDPIDARTWPSKRPHQRTTIRLQCSVYHGRGWSFC